jgi:hypothetical protein
VRERVSSFVDYCKRLGFNFELTMFPRKEHNYAYFFGEATRKEFRDLWVGYKETELTKQEA